MYLWIKTFHIVAMVAWFSGLFYLPRLFVYHVETFDTVGYNRFCTMERRLYRYIMTPSAIVAVVLGLWLLHLQSTMQLWLLLKILVVLLTGIYHLFCGHYLRKFAIHQNQHGTKFFRIMNEIPLLFLIATVALVVIKPY